MGQLRTSAALVGFYGDDLDPDEITDLLGMEATVGVVKGGTWVTSLGRKKTAYTGSWRIKADPCDSENLTGQIEGLLAPLTKNLEVWRELSSRFRGVIFCGLWLDSYNDGLELSPELLGLISERGLILDLDIYEKREH